MATSGTMLHRTCSVSVYLPVDSLSGPHLCVLSPHLCGMVGRSVKEQRDKIIVITIFDSMAEKKTKLQTT